MNDVDRRRRIDDICHGALECEPAARRAFVDAACGTDVELRRDVQALLAHAGTAEHYLSMPLNALAAVALVDDRRATLIGRQVGDYRILSLLGSGGMGDVYKAADSKLGRSVAIKFLPAAFAADADRLSRFWREAHVLASLNHPNVAHIYGLEDSGDTPCIVMEFVEGETLQARLKRGPLPVDEALAIARQMADALEAAHATHVIHRDLKPGNVMLTRDATVKVLDFGLAKDYGASLPANLSESPTAAISATSAGVLLGTAAYMSPEQARGKPVDQRADIWAFGCVLYEMLTGKQAFHGDDTTDTLAAVVKSEPDLAAIPARVRPLVRRCLEKDPQRRLRDIGDAMWVVEQTPESKGGTSRQWTPWAAPAAVAVVAALIVLGALSAIHLREQPSVAPAPIRFQIPAPDNKEPRYEFAAMSPDGRKVALQRERQLWVYSVDTGESRDLTATTGNVEGLPFWSPDSRFIGIPADGKLKRIEAMGTLVQTLCDVPVLFVGGAWNHDDVIIFGLYPGPIFQVPATGGVPVPVTKLDPSRQERTHEMPSFLPDGRHFLYIRRGPVIASSYYLGSLDAKPEEQSTTPVLTAAYSQPVYAPSADPRTGYVLFTRKDSALMAQTFDNRTRTLIGQPVPLGEHMFAADVDLSLFSVSANGVLAFKRGGADPIPISQLTWFDRKGKVLGTVGDPAGYAMVRLSPDGRLAATVRGYLRPDIWVMDLARGTSIRFTSEEVEKGDPVWSPDGSRIAFRQRGSESGLFVKPSNGTGAQELLVKSIQDPHPSSWSPDGRFLLYWVTEPKTRGDVWVLPLDGDRTPAVLLNTEFNEEWPVFSPDGRWIAYSSDESGRDEVYVRSFEPPSGARAPAVGAKRIISVNGAGFGQRWRSDGNELVYGSASDGRMMAVETATGPVFRAGSPQMMWQLPSNAGGGDMTADGKRSLIAIPVKKASSEPYWVVQNWPALLKH